MTTDSAAGLAVAAQRNHKRMRAGWVLACLVLLAVRGWNVLWGPLLQGYDDFAHIGYVLFLDRYAALPWADQGWAYFHPPLHYLLGWGFAQFDDAVALVRGLAFVSNAASFGIAAIAARVVWLASPQRPALAWLAFVSVGLLPAFLYSGNTAGNEWTAAFLAAVGLWWFIENECGHRPTVAHAAWAGLAIGFAILTKVSALLVLGAVGLSLLLRGLLEHTRTEWSAVVTRGIAVAGVAMVISAPFFVRNFAEYGSLSRLGTDFPQTARIERSQPPGSRSLRDFYQIPFDLFDKPKLDVDPLVHSVWGSAYVQMWADVRPGWDSVWKQGSIARWRTLVLWLGVAPTLLAVAGGMLAANDVRRGRRRSFYVPLLSIAVLSLFAFVWFALTVPRFSALKATYLLGLTLPYAAFMARAIEACSRGPRWCSAVAGLLVIAAAGTSAVANTSGWVVPPLRNQGSIAALQFYFEDLDAAQRTSTRWSRRRWFKTEWRDNLATIAMARGRAADARELYAVEPPEAGEAPFRWNSLAVASALAGDRERAIGLFSSAIAAGADEVGYANRGTLVAALGNLKSAEADLREAVRLDPNLAIGWQALAEVLVRTGRIDAAADAAAAAERALERAPRGYPYGIPDALAQQPEPAFTPRWFLWFDGTELTVSQSPYRHGHGVPAPQRGTGS